MTRHTPGRALLRLAGLALPLGLLAQPQLNTDFAYGANLGWINVQPQRATHVYVDINETFFGGFIYGANIGWISMGDGTPANGSSYANTSATDCGVNHDGGGALSGFAYSANCGWINFGWTTDPNDPNRPRFDLADGTFHGYAYGANIGWINLGSGHLVAESINRPDTDGDGIDDNWERRQFGNLTTAGLGTDRDGDGQSDAAEYVAGTNPQDAASFLRIVSHTYGRDQTMVTIVFTSSPARRYQIQHSTDLVNWSDAGAGIFAADPGATTTQIVVVPGTARHFFRAGAILPLPQ